MAAETYLIGIRWLDGNHDIISELRLANIDNEKLKHDGKLQDITVDEGFSDDAAILSVPEFQNYLLPKDSLYSPEVHDWYESIHDEADLILIHVAEF